MPTSYDYLDNRFLQLFLTYGVPLLVTGVLALLGYLLAARARHWQESTKTGLVWDSLRMGEELAGKAVAAALTDLQVEYRKLVADGNLSRADVDALQAKAGVILKDKLGATGMALLTGSLGRLGVSVDGFLATQVSAAISRLAGQDPTSVVTQVASSGPAFVVSHASPLPAAATPPIVPPAHAVGTVPLHRP